MAEHRTTRVAFYVLGATGPAARQGYACRLAEKAWRLDHRVHIHASSPGEAAELDDLLWTFRQGSFVPHELATDGAPAAAPVTIGSGDATPPEADLLINLADGVPPFHGRFARVAEIVDGTPECRAAGRRRHRLYREQGLEPETHEVT